ncbi:signal peptidase II [Hydrogenophaga sp.]|uniref:signal peptidase II n=1 Tax=Hydrogenophaga sp. TaxID=1904254 RepID=UPI0026236764|nr:signal peptidase II [Hydrogenophaga sp.]MCW5653405.1 lipoprotein signal peptidase [Hydrogenophaga sp.]
MDGTANSGRLWPWLALAALVLLADQLSKQIILATYQLGDSTYVTGFFNVVRVHNTGAAFSFLAGAGGWQRWFFTAVGVGAAVFIVWMLRSHSGQKLFGFALACILGGALGNVIDRLWHGYVVDWLDFHWPFLAGMFPGGHFPSFNLADVGISVGAAALILDEILRVRRNRR